MKYLKNLPFGPLLAASLFTTLVSCGGDSGQENSPGIPPVNDNSDEGLVYNGPVAENDDVQQFKLNVWDNLAGDDRCGGCHNEIEGQEPFFLRRDDINLAYETILPLVDKTAPVLSRIVQRAEEDHNVWSPAAADIIQNYVEAWATATVSASQNTIVLTEPDILRTVGDTKQLPASPDLYESTIYALVTNTETANCVECHSESSPARQQPYFASAVPSTAYAAARTLIDLNNASSSRFVRRMTEGHNVWADPTAAATPTAYSVQEMTAAVISFIDQIEDSEPFPEALPISTAQYISDGVVANSGGRIETDVIALYEFKEGSGSTAFDTSGVDPALDLNLTPTVAWVGSWGIRIEDNGKAFGDTASSKKLHDRIKETGEYSVEAWVIPANVVQEQARIVTYTGGRDVRNFGLNQNLYDYDWMTRSENSDANGEPMLSTPSADEVLQATLQHVVATYDPIEGRRLYVNGELISEDGNGDMAGSINDWNSTFALVVGNEIDNASWWEGTVRLLAIHNRVLTEEHVLANFDAGVGQKYFLLFNVSEHVDMPKAYVVFQVEVFDDYSYLFSSPFFISLDRDAVPTGNIPIKGLRIGINGKESPVSQAFASIDEVVSAANYDAATGVPLTMDASDTVTASGTLIGVQNGQIDDLFFLTFEQIGNASYTRPVESTPSPADPIDLEQQPEIGVRLFDEVFETMSAITTVPSARVSELYNNELRRSLPSAETAYGFLSSQQSAVTQLALAYCTELVGDSTLAGAYFGSYGALNSASEREAVIGPLLDHMLVNSGLETQPDPAAMRAELNGLIDNMTTNQTSTKVIAVCTAALASATMLMQ